MASTSEITYGSRLANAQKLAGHLATFTNYVPAAPEYNWATFQALISQIENTNTNYATLSASFLTNAASRQDLFLSGSASMVKRLTPIIAYIRAMYGKEAKETEMLVALIHKLRGASTAKLKKSADSEWVSQSQRSYGSMRQNFADVLATIDNLGTAYAPTNPLITKAALQQLLADLAVVTDNVNAAYGQYKILQDNRNNLYQDLSNRTARIKESVKSIYGTSSPEFKLIKGLRI